MFNVEDDNKAADSKADAHADPEHAAGHTAAGHTAAGHTAAGHTAAGHTAAGHTPAGHSHDAGHDHAAANEALQPIRDFMAKFITFIAILTCTFGNLAAYAQTNIKRLLAYSTIAHAGYMMMAVPALLAMCYQHPEGAKLAVAGLCIYIVVYVFMNLGAFAIIAFLRNQLNSEEIADYAGLLQRCPLMVVSLALILFSLVGLPPLSGFIGKFAIFASLAQGFQATGENYLMILLVAGGINTAISLFYYLRVVKVMTMTEPPEDAPEVDVPVVSMPGVYVLAVTAPTVLLIVRWEWVSQWAQTAAQYLVTG